MKSFTLGSQFNFPKHTNLTNPPSNPPFFIPTILKSHSKHPIKTPSIFKLSTTLQRYPTETNHMNKTQMVQLKTTPNSTQKIEFLPVSRNGYSRFVILGTMSVALMMFVMGIDDHTASALGPEGPLMEEFWDNMRRYGLYALTVSSGVLYAVFQPLVELLKNPISAILVLTIFGGGFYIVSQVVSAMVGVTDFSYDYSY
ncbi:hypothetical protein LguiA_015204 [Lonicera macranthoides]